MTVSASVELPSRPSQQTMALMARELERTEGVQGRGEFIGESLAWSTPELELRVVPSALGASVVLVRSLKKLIRKRLRRMMALAGFLAILLFGGLVEPMMGIIAESLSGFFFFTFVGAGMAGGWGLVRHTQRFRLAREQEQLNHTAQRLLAIAEAERTGGGEESLS
jgi:hypothetical protein